MTLGLRRKQINRVKFNNKERKKKWGRCTYIWDRICCRGFIEKLGQEKEEEKDRFKYPSDVII